MAAPARDLSVVGSNLPTRRVRVRIERESFKKAPLTGSGLVKAVPSADTLVLLGSTSDPNQLPAQKEVTLSGIKAPRYARGKKAQDEEWAFHAREFLRKLVIGRVVKFERVYKHVSGGQSDDRGKYAPREYCKVTINGQDIAAAMVHHGWAQVMTNEEGKVRTEHKELHQLQQGAQARGDGMWNKQIKPEETVRLVDWNIKGDAIYQKFHGKPIPALVDKVIDGSTFRLELTGGELLHHPMITLHLAGAQCPPTPLPAAVLKQRSDGGRKQTVEPFALEAQLFSQKRLLHRDVKVLIQGVDKYHNLFGTLLFVHGDITSKLLSMGLAKLVKWSAALTHDGDKLAQAEESAKRNRLRRWAEWSADEERKQRGETEFVGVVTQVLSGDRLEIQAEGAPGSRKFYLASIRAPRLGSRSNPEPEPCAMEAREWLRKQVLGKKVRCVVEYTRDSGREPESYVSVYTGKKCVNEGLLRDGLAEALRHRKNEERACNYDKLLAAEQFAEKRKVGKHHPAAKARATSFQDLTQRVRTPVADQKDGEGKQIQSEAKKALPTLAGSRTGVVEYVYSASKFKIWIPKANTMLNLVLLGVRSPDRTIQVTGPDGQSTQPNPLYKAATEYVRGKLNQREVQVFIEYVDKGDNFVGNVICGGENIGLSLVKQGMASLFTNSVIKSTMKQGTKDSFFDAAKQAKGERRGIWEHYVEKPRAERGDRQRGGRGGRSGRGRRDAEDGEEEKGRRTSNRLTKDKEETLVRLSELTDGATAFAQAVADDDDLAFMVASLQNLGESAEDPEGWAPKRGELAAGLYAEDGQWYRVQLEGTAGKGQWKAFFIDYGNTEVIPQTALHKLPEDLTKKPPLATEIHLSGCDAPSPTSDYFNGCGQAFSELAWGHELLCRVDCIDFGKIFVSLLDPEQPEGPSINEQLLTNGFLKCSKRPPRALKDVRVGGKRLLDLHKACEAVAHRNHRFIWEYGDISDDEEDNDYGRVPNVRKEKMKAIEAEAARKAKLEKNKNKKEESKEATKSS